MDKKEPAKKVFDLVLIKRLFQYLGPFKKHFVFSLTFTLVIAILSAARPILIKQALNNAVAKPNHELLITYITLLFALLFTESICSYFNNYLSSYLGQNIVVRLRTQIYNKIINSRLSFFDRTPVGTLVTRSVSDTEQLADVFAEGFIIIFGDILMITIYVGIMLYYNWQLALLSLSTIPFLIYATRIFQRGVHETFKDVRNRVAQLNAFAQEHITGMKIVQIFNREEEEQKRFEAINAKHKDANIKNIWYYSVFFPVIEILSSISIGLLIFRSGALSSTINIGEIVSFILLIQMTFRPIRMMADRINTLQTGLVSAERLFVILDNDEQIKNEGTLKADNITGHIQFKNVWFAYKDDEWVLRDVSFEVIPNQSVAFVGATGAGKSSIISLINRFYEYTKGEILIDGINIREYDIQSLRENIGLVMQDVFLFSGSIEDNITMGKAYSEAEIMQSATDIGANFIEHLPNQLKYDVRERGVTLSVGQRQLIAFLRTYLSKPKVLILDEATANIDSESERMIQHATDKMMHSQTSILIAHRISTIQKANCIFVLSHGKIVEQGNHQSLYAQKGYYYNLIEAQEKEETKSIS